MGEIANNIINNTVAFTVVVDITAAFCAVCLLFTIVWFITRNPKQLGDLFINPPGVSPDYKRNLFLIVALATLVLALAAQFGY